MSFKVVNALHIPGIDFGEDLLVPFNASLVKGQWRNEEEIIRHAGDADALICSGPVQPITSRVLEALSGAGLSLVWRSATIRLIWKPPHLMGSPLPTPRFLPR